MTVNTLGIIGSGQLGSLLCQAAKKLNIKTIVISDDENGPAQNYSGEFIYSQYDNKEKIKEFVSKVDIIIFIKFIKNIFPDFMFCLASLVWST